MKKAAIGDGLESRTDRTGEPSKPRPSRATGKLSEQLASVAEPWTNRLDQVPGPNETALIYGVAGQIWNASRLETQAERVAGLEKILELLVPALPQLPPDALRELVEEMHDRARRLYPDDRRRVADIEVEDRGDGHCRVIVASMNAIDAAKSEI